jgi:hypothetical protein
MLSLFLIRVMMEKVFVSVSDIIHAKPFSRNNMLQLPLMLCNLDTDNIPLIMKLLNITMPGKMLQFRTHE